MMKRTQIYFPEELAENLRLGATLRNISISEYIRLLLQEKTCPPLTKKPVRVSANQARPSLIARGGFAFGKKDMAKNFRKYFEASLR